MKVIEAISSGMKGKKHKEKSKKKISKSLKKYYKTKDVPKVQV